MMTRADPYQAPRRRRGEQDYLRQNPHPCSSLRVTRGIALLALFGALRLSTSFATQTSTERLPAAQTKVGVVVERVEQGEAAEAAGVQVGDRIVEWVRAESSG